MNDKTNDTVFGQWFKDQGDPARNPIKIAQAAMNKPLPKRFYKTATIEQGDAGFNLLLDGKKARTPAKNHLALPTMESAHLLAEEWASQKDIIDPSNMHITRMVNAGIDNVGNVISEVQAEISKYATSELLCYRASEPPKLVIRQSELWNPVLDWAKMKFEVHFALAEGIMFVAQPVNTLKRMEQEVQRLICPIALSALYTLVTISGSLLLSLAVADKYIEAKTAYDIGELEADFTTEIWGLDEESYFRRQRRATEFEAAAKLLLTLNLPV